MKRFHHLLSFLFSDPEEINGGNRCPTYLFRWFLLRTRWFKAYIHHFVADDWSLDHHDHPKRFISIGLWGWYREERPTPEGIVWEEFHAPWFRTFPAEHIHCLKVPSGNCWTLIFVLRGTRPWGFWHEGRFIPFKAYVQGVDGIADRMTACASLDESEVRNAR